MALDLAAITGFDWDDDNSRKSTEKHGVSQAETEQVFVNRPLIVTEDSRHSAQEARYHALGRSIEGRLLHVTFTLRQSGTTIRVISVRGMNRKERTVYDGARDEEDKEA